MIYTELTKKAMKLMFKQHKDQLDKSDIPYVFHPWHLAEQMNDEKSTVVALLHDVVEDTDMTLEDIAAEGFDDEIIEALSLLTHDDGVDYFDYVKKVATNPIAAKVKMADLQHNSDISRLDVVSEKDIERKKKYHKAMDILNPQYKFKKIVGEMYKIAQECVVEATIPSHYYEALDVVENTIKCYVVKGVEIYTDMEKTDVNWEKLMYQIMVNVRRAWCIASDYYDDEDAIGLRLITHEFQKIMSKEGITVYTSKLSKEDYEEEKRMYGLV